MWFYLVVFLLLLFIYLSYRPIYPRGSLSHTAFTSTSPNLISTHIITRTHVPNNPDPQYATTALTQTHALQFVKTGYGIVHVELLAPEGGKEKLTLEEMGTLSNLIVLIHGFSIPMIIWSSVAAALRRAGWYVLLMDNYGRGYSDSPDVTHAGGLYVSQLNQVLTQLNITRPIHLAGVSMGGAISALYTSTFPSHVASLTLVCAAGFPPRTPPIAHLLKLPIIGDVLFKIAAPKQVLTSEATWQHKGTSMYHAYCRFILNLVSSHPGYLRALFRTLCDFPMGQLASVYSAIGREPRPVLIIWGSADTLLPYSQGLSMHQSMPHSQLITIDGSNHNMLIDNPIPIGDAMITFYKKIMS